MMISFGQIISLRFRTVDAPEAKAFPREPITLCSAKVVHANKWVTARDAW
jgi:hypothetical protein